MGVPGELSFRNANLKSHERGIPVGIPKDPRPVTL